MPHVYLILMEQKENLISQKENPDSVAGKDQPKNNGRDRNSKNHGKKSDKPEKVLKYHDPDFRFDVNTVERLSTFNCDSSVQES